jgi:hypothetical protein
MIFHTLELPCPKCGKDMTIVNVLFDCDGNILTQAACAPPCSEKGVFISNILDMVGKCRVSEGVDLVFCEGNATVN